MPNFVLKKHFPINVDANLNVGINWIVRSNEIWVSTYNDAFYSSDFGASFTSVAGSKIDSDSPFVRVYFHNNDVYLYTFYFDLQTGTQELYKKWNGNSFITIIDRPVILISSPTYQKETSLGGFTYDSFSNNVIRQSGDFVSLLFNMGTGDAGDLVEVGGNVYLSLSNFPNTTMFKYDGISVTTQFSIVSSRWYKSLYQFGGLTYYFEAIEKKIGTIDILTGSETLILTLPEAGVMVTGGRTSFFEIIGKLYLVVSKTPFPNPTSEYLFIYEFNGVTFVKVADIPNVSMEWANQVGNGVVLGFTNNDFYENECNIFYNGATKTNETNVAANDGTITHDVDITAAIGIVNYRLLDASEVEVVTWQVSDLFTGLAPGSYLLEARDETCTTRYINTLGVLAFNSAIEEQTPSRSRNYLNTANFTRYYQIFGMSVQDFQALEGELPPPVDEAIGAVPENINARITDSGDTRITETGDRRVTS